MYVHIYYVRIYIYIGTYLLSEGSEDPSKIFFGPVLGQKNWGKKIGITGVAKKNREGVQPGGFVLSPDLVWYCRVLLLFSASDLTDTG